MVPLVVLVGPPGSGKTTVGTILAADLDVEFRDTDDDIESLAGTTIPDIFVDEGESGFRVREVAAVRSALNEHRGVLSIGGGAVESAEVRELLRDQLVVQLTIGPSEAGKRVGISGARPLMLGNVRSRWNELMHRRQPLYEEVATVSVATDARTPQQVAGQIRSVLPGSL